MVGAAAPPRDAKKQVQRATGFATTQLLAVKVAVVRHSRSVRIETQVKIPQG